MVFQCGCSCHFTKLGRLMFNIQAKYYNIIGNLFSSRMIICHVNRWHCHLRMNTNEAAGLTQTSLKCPLCFWITSCLCMIAFLIMNKPEVCYCNTSQTKQNQCLLRSLPHLVSRSEEHLQAKKLSVSVVSCTFISSSQLQERKLLCMVRNKSAVKQWCLL